MESETFSALGERARQVVQSLNWQIYHTPENLTLFLLGEAAELGEYCQWLSKAEIEQLCLADALSEEIADVIKSVLYLANTLPLAVHLESVLIQKLQFDAEAYPIKKYRDKSRYQVRKTERRKGKIPLVPEDSPSDIPPIATIQRMAWQFVQERAWEQFYDPASLALAIAVKSGEVATCYQRRPKPIKFAYERMIWALADILLNAMRLCEFMDIQNIFQIVREKLDKDEKRFR
jgi:NTP pyrophosphatase (non-canonical NTP hydrolase)